MGNIITIIASGESENDKMSRMEPEQREQYWKCNKDRIESREYYKNNPDEWYEEYMF